MNPVKLYHKSIKAMSTHLDIDILWAEDKPTRADKIISEGFREAERIINIISAWQPDTQLAKVNKNAGIRPVKVCDELFYLVQRSIKISNLTHGLFDVTFASIDKIWFFDKPMLTIPDNEMIKKSIRNINYEFIELDNEKKTLFIKNKGTKIELGATGKGYVINKVKEKLMSLGVESGLVNAGGDLVTWGNSISGNEWNIGIIDPESKGNFVAWIPLKDKSVATSGSYERYVEFDGIRYSHIISPKTGYPVNGIKSVTVIGDDAELCDAIATAIYLMGKERGLLFINQFYDLQCFIVDDELHYHYSENMKKVEFDKKIRKAEIPVNIPQSIKNIKQKVYAYFKK